MDEGCPETWKELDNVPEAVLVFSVQSVLRSHFSL